MFPFPGALPGPMGMMPPPMAPATNAFGKVQYKYVTPDGSVPMDGAVPSAPDAPPNPFAGTCIPGAMHPFGGPPNPFGPPPCLFAPAAPQPWWAAPPPPPYCVAPPAPPAAPSTPSWSPPPPPPPVGHAFGASNEDREEPLEGNRVKGQLATFPDNSSGYIFPKRNVTLHLFGQNVISKYPPVNNVVNIQNDKFNVQHAPCDMTFEELIEQINCEKRANHHPPYNQPGNGYPRHLIGIQELLEMGGGGRFMLGSKIMLTDAQAKMRIGDIWPDSAGNAGQGKPRYVVRLPV